MIPGESDNAPPNPRTQIRTAYYSQDVGFLRSYLVYIYAPEEPQN
jgi:hypothetical protein